MNKTYLFSTSKHPQTININPLQITLFKPEIDFSAYDYLIITSKQTIEVLKQYDKNDFIHKKALCVSKKTAQSFEELGGTLLDVGQGYGDNLLPIIEQYPKNTKWLYLRAKKVASSFSSDARKKHLKIDERVVYETKCSDALKEMKIEENATLIFTSPTTIKCFLKYFNITKNNKIVVIGKTTLKALPKDVKYGLACDTTVDSCVELSKVI